MDNDQTGYAEALQELQAILTELEGEAVDVDVLAVRVARADELLTLCRERLEAASVQVEKVVAAADDA
ncbi:MAG: exodeoxyribonuclease VII small subunit [Acidimicrobiales bacterium]|jgi:exodeoxyribonuclease VII small subunit|nr:exodeoxyribonuclease VII small subunit [Acidimicrobiales bacterium]MDE0749863.1 exodeoxyribonuclease VII small subunit [Acidimicrobiales bacterium]|tara:strand:+ start:2656 stop:2859 length:204 start_codon:yes stop_codon:yes gene_type:complete